MRKHPSLLADVEQFFYSYAPNALYKKQLFDIIKQWEDAYQEKILELELKASKNDTSRMTSEGGLDYEDMRGNRYDDFDG